MGQIAGTHTVPREEVKLNQRIDSCLLEGLSAINRNGRVWRAMEALRKCISEGGGRRKKEDHYGGAVLSKHKVTSSREDKPPSEVLDACHCHATATPLPHRHCSNGVKCLYGMVKNPTVHLHQTNLLLAIAMNQARLLVVL